MLVANSMKPYATNTGIITMKTLQDLLGLQAKAMEMYHKDTGRVMGEVFFSFSGHVNSMSATYYPLGFEDRDKANSYEFTTYLTEEGIQAMYWWMVVNLRVTNRK